MRSNLSKYYFLIPIIPFIYSLFFSTYIYDGYHYGLMFSNALDLNNGKLPYKEIFIEYGYLTTLIHSIIIKILGNEVYFLQVYTALIYSITLSVISVIIKKLTNNYYAFFSIISLILIYPIPLKPWAIYNSYLFYSLAIFFILDLKKKNLFISGLLIGLSYLSFTTLYNFIVIPLVLLILLYFYIFNKSIKEVKIKLFYFLFGLIIPIFFFNIYLFNNNLFESWLTYQKLPIDFQLEITDKTIKQQIFFFINELTIEGFKNYIIKPHQLLFGIIYVLIIGFISKIFYFKFSKKVISEIDKKVFLICLLIFSLTPHIQIGGIEKLTTSLTLGYIIIMSIIHRVKNLEFKYFIFTFLTFTTLFIFKNNLTNPEYLSIKIDTHKKYYNEENINFFKLQKWEEKKWLVINGIIKYEKKINEKCRIIDSANLTNDSFYYSIMNNKIQLIPFFNKRNGSLMRKIIEPNLINNIQTKIDKNNIFIISSSNNDKLFILDNFRTIKEYNIAKSNLKIRSIYIMVPKKCYEAINLN